MVLLGRGGGAVARGGGDTEDGGRGRGGGMCSWVGLLLTVWSEEARGEEVRVSGHVSAVNGGGWSYDFLLFGLFIDAEQPPCPSRAGCLVVGDVFVISLQ